MKRHNGLVRYSKEHHQGLIVAQLVKKNAPKYPGMPVDNESKLKYVLAFVKDELQNHFRDEENILILAISGIEESVDRLNERVITEHRQILKIIDELNEIGNLESNLDKFGIALDEHIRFEERTWFEKIQETFTAEELNKRIETLKKT